jgi:hypothetical protein
MGSFSNNSDSLPQLAPSIETNDGTIVDESDSEDESEDDDEDETEDSDEMKIDATKSASTLKRTTIENIESTSSHKKSKTETNSAIPTDNV